MMSIDGYSIIRDDRHGRSNYWGGTVIYYYDSLKVFEVEKDHHMKKLKSSVIEVMVKSQEILISVCLQATQQQIVYGNLQLKLNCPQ